MAQQTIDIGSAPNDGTGDPIRDAFDKCNDNFTELYAGLVGLLDFKGSTDCSANPSYPSASKGDFYVVSVAGKIGGASGIVVEVGDAYFAKADNAGGTQASVGSSWTVIQANIVGGTINALDDIPDVNAPSPSNNDTIAWDSVAGEYVNVPLPGGGAGGTVPDGGTTGQVLTKQSGVDQDVDWDDIPPTDLGAFHAYDEKASGTAGGGTTANTWHERILNTVAVNSISGAAQVTSTVTMTIASPCVVTWNSHGLAAGAAVVFTTTGALPTGLTAGTTYYVLSPGANSFNVSATPGGAAINTSGSQSGTHTAKTGQITLPAGTYEVFASAPVYDDTTYGSSIRLYNASDAAAILAGTTNWTNVNMESRTFVQGRFTLASQKNVSVHSFPSTTQATNGLGVNAGLSGVPNHFTDVKIKRVA